MRRVVVTGIGIVSSIGDNADEVAASLKAGKSGVIAAPEYAELNFKCQVHEGELEVAPWTNLAAGSHTPSALVSRLYRCLSRMSIRQACHRQLRGMITEECLYVTHEPTMT